MMSATIFFFTLTLRPTASKKLDKNKIVRTRPAQIRKCRIKSKIIRVELNNALEAIVRASARTDKSRTDSVEHNILECACLWLAHGNCHDWHLLTYPTDEA
jgi:hypothetical protein